MKRPTAPLIISTAALFVAMGGTGLAASHYLITSTRQISPGVLRKLERAQRGKPGLPGLPGAPGAPGATGPQGPGATAINYTSTSPDQATPELIKTVGPLSLYGQCHFSGANSWWQERVGVVASSPGWNVPGNNGSAGPNSPVSTAGANPSWVWAADSTTYVPLGQVVGYNQWTVLITDGSTVYTIDLLLSSGTPTTDCTVVGSVIPAN